MGWTSMGYHKATHDEFSDKRLKEFLEDEYVDRGISFAMVHIDRNKGEHVVYCLARKQSSSLPFIFVILLKIEDNNIYWKDIMEHDAPRPTRCPKEFFKWVPTAPTEYAKEWREHCIEANVELKRVEL